MSVSNANDGFAPQLDERPRMGPNGAEPACATVPPAHTATELAGLAWYALAVRSRCEKGVAAELERLQVEHYLPLRSVRRIWRDRIKTVEVAYFPGYVFARSTLIGRERYRIVDLSDVVCVVGHSHERAGIAIPAHEIDNVRQLVERASDPQPCAAIASGTRVVVAAGPLKGIEGVVETHRNGRQRIVCSITLLNRAVRAEIDVDSLIPLTEFETGLAGKL